MIAAAVCPHPPALVPEVAAGAAPELADVRTAALASVAVVLGARPDRVVVVGGGPLPGDLDESAGGTLHGHGVDVRAGGPELVLPLAHTVGAWLLDRSGWRGPRTYTTEAVPLDDRTAVLVMADGSARRSLAAPGYVDARAEAFDQHIADALASGDAAALSALDTDLGDELLAAGVRPLVALGAMTKGADRITPRLRWSGAPFGVGYWVADWTIG